MPLELVHTIHSDYLEVQIQGERTIGNELEEAIRIWSQIFGLTERYFQNNILAHVRVKRRFPVRAQIDFSFRLTEIGCTPDHRIAVVAYSSEIFKNASIIEKYLLNEGYSTRIFKSKEKARRWLLRKKKKPSFLNIFDSFK